jgi:hypothetical protein
VTSAERSIPLFQACLSGLTMGFASPVAGKVDENGGNNKLSKNEWLRQIVSRPQVFVRPLKDSASPVVASTSENENAASWKRRYPNLTKHLELGRFMIQAVTWIAAIGIIVLTITEFRAETEQAAATDSMVAPTTSQVEPGSAITIEPLLYGVAAEISLAIFYIANMVSIEFIKVICSIEQESVLARLERQDGTQAVK